MATTRASSKRIANNETPAHLSAQSRSKPPTSKKSQAATKPQTKPNYRSKSMNQTHPEATEPQSKPVEPKLKSVESKPRPVTLEPESDESKPEPVEPNPQSDAPPAVSKPATRGRKRKADAGQLQPRTGKTTRPARNGKVEKGEDAAPVEEVATKASTSRKRDRSATLKQSESDMCDEADAKEANAKEVDSKETDGQISMRAEGTQFFLVKSEPESRMQNGKEMKFSIDDLIAEPQSTAQWDGVRNFEARNVIREMKLGDRAFFYHSNSRRVRPAIVGEVEIVKEAYPGTFGPPFFD